MKERTIKNLICISLMSFLIISISSCKGIQISNSKLSSATEFSKGEALILVCEEKNKYENRFGKDVWTLKSGDGKTDFKNYVVDNVKVYAEKLMTLKLYAKEHNISILERDEKTLEDCANEYYNSLTKDDLDFINCTFEDVLNLYKDYHLVNLTINELTKNSNIELSISEAKVVSVEYIKLDSKEEADTVREQLNLRNANFSFYAKKYNTDGDITMIIKRGDEMSTLFPEVFYLSKGQISDVLSYQNEYYIFKCTNDYMEKETKKRKEEILQNIKNREFNEQYSLFEENNRVFSNATYWKEIDLALYPNSKNNNFYEIYEKIFNE